MLSEVDNMHIIFAFLISTFHVFEIFKLFLEDTICLISMKLLSRADFITELCRPVTSTLKKRVCFLPCLFLLEKKR